jgi:AraC family transcriptional regulator of adaptative response/methylated-DNA-[protein]-cysteine methyltransferase
LEQANMQALNIPHTVPAARFDDDEARWAAVQARDARADDVFFYSVRTTGVYCRPSCAARPARRENVAFHASQAAAVAAGFRACKRCQPDQAPRAARHAALVAEACRLIESAEQPPDLNSLADSAGLSPFHFHRVFKRIVGVTPKAYADARRAARVRDGLEAGDSVTRVAYDAGFNSNGRFYDHVPRALGMQPTRFRAGGAGETIRFAVGQCALGAILVAATARGICTIELGDDPAALLRDFEARFKAATLQAAATPNSSSGWRAWWASSNSRRSVSTCRWTSAARRSRPACGRRCAPFRRAVPRAMPRSRRASARRVRCARWRRPAPPTRWRWRFPVTA